ncbi:MAG: hypothetical protein RDU14_17050 [Melioribacteraceae bacterium]|nr:hypothetical protein [Melioribacteraceae bacterium]
MPHDEIPKHIKDKVWADLSQKIPYSVICEKWGIKSKSTINAIKKEYLTISGIAPISPAEKQRRKKIGKAAVTVHAFRNAEYIAQGFINAFEVIAYNSQHLIEVIDHSKSEADSLKEKQEEILEGFKKYVEMSPEQKVDVMLAIRQSIQKINDFFTRDMIRIKAVGEMRKQLETFLKMKQEIMDIQTIKKMLDAFFNGCNELDDVNYRKYRDRVIADAPITDRLFAAHEQQATKPRDDSDSNKQE